ncbi:YbbR-like domain-containing protein [candidate division KSB1 bacterium]|nr:YbbR-like domain-containing protein [candidate division KSB1 bacterium]
MAFNRTLFKRETNFWQQHKIKIASTLVAIFIWFLVVTDEVYEYETTIPIEISQKNPDYIITSKIPAKARIILQGSGRYLVGFMLFREGRLRLDINWTAGEHILLPTRENIFLSSNTRKLVVRQLLGPDSIQYKIERLVAAKIPVRNTITLKPMPGYTIVGDIILEPDSIRVQGPEKAVAQLDSVNTQNLTRDNLKFRIHEHVPLLPPADKQITLLDPHVTLAADVQRLLEKVIPQVPVTVRYLPQNIDALVHPSHISLKVQGGMQIISPLNANDINAYVEYQATPDSILTNIPISIEPIPGVSFRDKSSERVKITFIRHTDQ